MKTIKKQQTPPKTLEKFKEVSGVTYSTSVKIKLDNKLVRQVRGD